MLQLASELPAPAVAGSSQRGIILHKLMEEVLTGETSATAAELRRRAEELMAQLGLVPVSDPASGISPAELAATVEHTVTPPEVWELRERLLPEHSIFGHESAAAGEIPGGRCCRRGGARCAKAASRPSCELEERRCAQSIEHRSLLQANRRIPPALRCKACSACHDDGRQDPGSALAPSPPFSGLLALALYAIVIQIQRLGNVQ